MERLLRAALMLTILASIALSAGLVRRTVSTSAQRVPVRDVTDVQGGIIVDHAVRAGRGLPIYQEPDTTHCPLLYTPGYYYAAALLIPLTGDAVTACRLTSVLFLAAAVAVLMALSWRLTRSVLATLAVLPTVCAGYPGTGFFYDAPRVDPASSFAIVLGVFLAVRGKGAKTGAAVGACLALAFFCKQSTAAFSGLFLLLLFFARRPVGLAAAGSFGVLVAVLVAVAGLISDGWFWKICVFMPADHAVPWKQLVGNFRSDWMDLNRGQSLLLVPIVGVLIARWRGDRTDRDLRLLLFAFAAVLVLTTLAHARDGGTVKSLMPAVWLLGALIPIGLWRAGRGWTGIASRIAPIVTTAAFAAFAWNASFEEAGALVPTPARRAWEDIAAVLDTYAEHGQVWAAVAGDVTTEMPGQGMRPGEIALNDYLKSGRNPLPPSIVRAISSHRFAMILVKQQPARIGRPPRAGRFKELVERYYEPVRTMPYHTGIRHKRGVAGVYVPRREDRPG